MCKSLDWPRIFYDKAIELRQVEVKSEIYNSDIQELEDFFLIEKFRGEWILARSFFVIQIFIVAKDIIDEYKRYKELNSRG